MRHRPLVRLTDSIFDVLNELSAHGAVMIVSQVRGVLVQGACGRVAVNLTELARVVARLHRSGPMQIERLNLSLEAGESANPMLRRTAVRLG